MKKFRIYGFKFFWGKRIKFLTKPGLERERRKGEDNGILSRNFYSELVIISNKVNQCAL